MAAELIRATQACPVHRLRLPGRQGASAVLEEVRHGLAEASTLHGAVILDSGDWPLHTGDLRDLTSLLHKRGLKLVAVQGHCRTTRVAAAALGLAAAPPATAAAQASEPAGEGASAAEPAALLVHRGTLRSGEHLQARGSVLLLGDLNPGGRISAGGHVFVWGRLRGVAHAGRFGDAGARIVALHLQPLQLRIASAVARGPEERPPEGFAEEARLSDGEIRIEPASPTWPLPAAGGEPDQRGVLNG